MSYHSTKRASQTENGFRMSLSRDDTMKLVFHDLNTYTYERRIWPTQLGVSCGERVIRSFQLGHYRSITGCALVWM
jgi:hypothetical protein